MIGTGASAGDPAARREALRGRLAEAGLDALLVTSLVNVRYLTGFTGSAGRVLIAADGEDRFVTDGRYDEQAATQVPDLPRTITREDDWLPDAVGGRKRLGLESHTLPWDAATALTELLPDVEVVAAAGHVEALREIKDETEVAAIARACAIADAAFTALVAELRPGWTEREVANSLERGMVDRGAEMRAFETIVASGPNGARPHHRPTGRVLERGDLITIDFGALVDGYHSDCTRVLAIGEPAPELRAVVDLVVDAQQAGLDAVADGAGAGEVDAACRERITAAGRGDAFVHGTGHGVGLEVHEAPRLAAEASATLRTRMVVTVEPGVYLPGLGGARIEDTVLVGPDGHVVLTETPKDLLIL